MGWKKAAAAALALTLVLAGCGGRSFYQALDDILNGDNSADVWRADVDYADMDAGGYGLEDFEKSVRDFDALTASGGTEEAFRAAETALREGVYRLNTNYILLSNASYADTGDTQLADAAGAAMEEYLDAYDQFMLAHRRMAESGNAGLLKSVYDDSYIAYFKSYEAPADGEASDPGEESRLVARYYALAGDPGANAGELADIYLRLVELRNESAELAGYASYAEMAYDSLYARSYTPEEARALWGGAKEVFAPLVRRATERVMPLASELEADRSLDCSEEGVLDALGDMAERLSPELEEACDYLVEHHLYDLSDSPRKAGVGFTSFLYAYNEPFIFNAPSGTFYDYSDTAHEFGHFASFYFSPSELLFGLADNDLSELQSQGMSVVMSFLFDDLFGAERGRIMRDCVLLELAVSVVDGAMYDEFQQRVYGEDGLTAERLDEIFSEVYLSYGYEPYPGYEREWMEVAHNFESPFYYISYAASALGALELNQRCEEDFDAGLADFLRVLHTDPEMYYYTDALRETGLSDIFDTSTYADTAAALAGSLDAAESAAA